MSGTGMGRVFRPQYTYKGEKRRSGIYWLDYSIRGERIRESTADIVEGGATTKKEAQALLHDRLAERGLGISRRDLEKITYEDLRELILADYEKNGRKSTDSLRHALAHLDRKFGGWRVVNIAEGAIDRYAAERRREGAANGTINRELSALRRMLNLGHRTRMVGRVPHVQMLEEDNVRTGFVEDGEFQALHDKLPPRLRPLAAVAFVTGWRRSELLSRKWRHVDLDNGWLRLEPGETKNGRGRQFPLIQRLREILEAQHARKREIENETGRIVTHVFFYHTGKRAGKPIKSFRRAWRAARKAAGMPDLHVHDFRRTAIRNMVRAGIPEKVAMEYSGHRTRSVFDRYNIVDETMLREQAEKLTAHLERVEPENRKVVPLEKKRAAG